LRWHGRIEHCAVGGDAPLVVGANAVVEDMFCIASVDMSHDLLCSQTSAKADINVGHCNTTSLVLYNQSLFGS
jgi:hypothetical protein